MNKKNSDYFLTGRWRSYLEKRPLVARILGNSGWVFADRVLGLLIGLFVGLWVARYLGPESYGHLQFCLATAGICGGISTLGLETIALRDFVSRPEDRERTIAAIMLLRLASGIVCGAIALAAIWIWRPEGSPERSMILWMAWIPLLMSTDTVDSYFQSQYRSAAVVRAKWVPVTLAALLRVVLILYGATLIAFGRAELFEAGVMSVGMLLLFAKSGLNFRALRPDRIRILELLREGWAFSLASLGLLLYLSIDQIMLGNMVGAKETGLYTAASKISGIWYFVPVAIALTSFPAVVESRGQKDLYKRRFQELHDLMFLIAFSSAVSISLAAPLIVRLLFGTAYAGAVPMLRIHAWSGFFVAWGLIFGRWLTAEHRGKFFAVATTAAALTNIVLNFFLIPIWGGIGASVATVAAYAVSSTGAALFTAESREIVGMQWRSLKAPLRLWQRLRNHEN
jgi:PST family polysaccharide transporter